MYTFQLGTLVIPTVAAATLCLWPCSCLSAALLTLSASLHLASGPPVYLVMYSGLWPIPCPQAEKAGVPQAGVN